MKIIIVGEEGVGKTTVGLEVAEKLSLPFFNQDDLLHSTLQFPQSKEYNSQQYREKKRLENSIISQILSQQQRFVFSSGAGFLNGRYDDEELLTRVKSLTTLICLKKNSDEFRERHSSIVIDVNEKSIDEVVQELLDIVSLDS